MRKTIGIFAHVDAGKTTLSQQILLLTGALRDQAAPGGRELLLDDAPLERRRGITIFSSNAHFTHGGQEYTLIDTPGHVDFCAEAERCAPVLDCAVLVVSAVDVYKRQQKRRPPQPDRRGAGGGIRRALSPLRL